jgi:hypothetical protein
VLRSRAAAELFVRRWKRRGLDILSYEDAKHLVLDQWSELWQSELGVGLVVNDHEADEYEWGWMLSYGPADPAAVPADHWLAEGINMAVVDRMTGRVESVTTSGPNVAIVRLLEGRPPELRAGLIEVRGTTGLVQIRVADRAFQVLRQRGSAEPRAAADGPRL